MAIGLTVQLNIKEGENDGFEAAIAGARARVRAEDAGCEMYDLFRSVEDATRYVMVERWASQADLDAHMKSPATAEMAKIGPFVAGAPVMTQYELE